MIKHLTCIECPKGCSVTIEAAADGTIRVSGNQCKKGEKYGMAEIQNPVRFFTSIVRSQNLSLKMIPVRTSKPIPKDRIFDAMNAVKKIKVTKAVKIGETISNNFLNLAVDLIATRDAE